MSALAGYPLIVVPLDFNKSDNEPYGLMFAGNAWSESMLLRIGHGFEQALPIGNTVRPKYAEKHRPVLEFRFKIIEFLKKLQIFLYFLLSHSRSVNNNNNNVHSNIDLSHSDILTHTYTLYSLGEQIELNHR